MKRYLVAGLLVWVPLGITIWVLHFLVTTLDSTLLLFPDFLNPDHLLGFHLPGLGVVLSFAILLLTGEWSQRSILATFTQEPRRIRVLNAKLTAAMMLSVGGAVFGASVAAVGVGLATASGRSLEANLSVGSIVGYLLFVILNVFAAAALGALLQSSAAAIAVSSPASVMVGYSFTVSPVAGFTTA